MRGKIIDKIAAQFSKAASTYDAASVVEQEVGRRLIERLKDLPITPRNILDLGCGTGYFTPHLQELFPDAKIINLDFALEMVKIAKHKTSAICACATRLPFANHSIDLIFSNCCLPHIPEIRTALTEIQRVLSGNGVLLFTSYGYRTLEELGMSGRDELLGNSNQDHDWVVVGATAAVMLKQGFVQVGKDFPVFLHPETKEEYALARTERKTAKGYYGFSCNAGLSQIIFSTAYTRQSD